MKIATHLVWLLCALKIFVVPSIEANQPLVDCYATLTSPSGNFTPPGYPNLIVEDINCAWLIVAADDSFITLSFTFFVLDDRFDLVRVDVTHFQFQVQFK
jgi:CUB domain